MECLSEISLLTWMMATLNILIFIVVILFFNLMFMKLLNRRRSFADFLIKQSKGPIREHTKNES